MFNIKEKIMKTGIEFTIDEEKKWLNINYT
jgi:hypothetical protein